MNRCITRLKSAYRSQDRARLIGAARALIAYTEQHPFSLTINPGSAQYVALARRIARELAA